MGGVNGKIKRVWMRGMQMVGKTASNIANNTKYKVDEMTLQNRRREILSDFGTKAYALWLKGESFPEPLEKQLQELQEVDNRLNDMRAAHYSNEAAVQDETPATDGNTDGQDEGGEEKQPDDAEDEQTDESGEPAEEEIPVNRMPVTDHPESAELSSVINTLFDEQPSVHEIAEKVNQSLDQMTENLRNFSEGEKEGKDIPGNGNT